MFDVPGGLLVQRLGTKLQQDSKFAPPEWAKFAKTGVHREKAPTNPNWWTTRVASILRRVYVDGPIGIVRISSHYGGTRDRGGKPNRARLGSRSIVRHALKQMEAAGYAQNIKGRGRVVTPKGRKILDLTAHEAFQDLVAKTPELAKY